MAERFVSEPIEPAPGEADAGRAARGEPGLPHRFRWRGQEYTVEEVLETWKTTSPCHHGSGERYVGKHFYRVRVAGASAAPTTAHLTGLAESPGGGEGQRSGAEMTLYFERQARRGGGRQWRIFSMKEG